MTETFKWTILVMWFGSQAMLTIAVVILGQIRDELKRQRGETK